MDENKLTICYLFANTESIHCQRWIKYFADKGHRIHLITNVVPKCDNNLKDIKLQLHTTTKRFSSPVIFLINLVSFIKKKLFLRRILHPVFNLISLISPFKLIRIRKIIKEIKPEIIHCHDIANGRPAALLGLHPLIVTLWGSDILFLPKSKIERFFIKYTLKKADLITCGGDATKKKIIKLGISPQKIKTTLRYIDLEQFSPLQKKTNRDAFTIISTRWLTVLYDVESLIRAVPFVLTNFPKANFIIVGNGPQEKYLKELAKSMNLESRISFAGHISHEKLSKYLASSDVYVSTALSDGGVAASVLEAMACCLPCVVTDVSDYKRWIKNAVNGFVVPKKNPEALAKKIIYLLANENLRKTIGENNRKLVIETQKKYGGDLKIVGELYNKLAKAKIPSYLI